MIMKGGNATSWQRSPSVVLADSGWILLTATSQDWDDWISQAHDQLGLLDQNVIPLQLVVKLALTINYVDHFFVHCESSL